MVEKVRRFVAELEILSSSRKFQIPKCKHFFYKSTFEKAPSIRNRERVILIVALLINMLAAGAIPVAATEKAGPFLHVQDSPTESNPYWQDSPLRIGVLLPEEGVVSAYTESMQLAIDVIRQQIQNNASLPRIEFVEAKLANSELQNNAAIGRLVSRGVDAIIAPNFLSALITASSETLDVLPLVSRAGKTHELALTGETSLYSDLSEHSVIIRTIQKLKFRGRLEQVVVMYDPTDAFGRFGYEIVVDVLSKEKASFSTEIFSPGSADFLAKLDALKDEGSRATVIIVGTTKDVADVIVQAQDEIGLTGNVLGFIGDGNPAVYDLADRQTSRELSGVAWDIVPPQELSDLLVGQFDNDRFAAEAYVAIWTILRGINDEHPPSRAGVRNAFIEHEGNNLDLPSAWLAALFYRTTRDSITQAIENLDTISEQYNQTLVAQ